MLEKFERSALMMVLSKRTEMNGLLSLAKTPRVWPRNRLYWLPPINSFSDLTAKDSSGCSGRITVALLFRKYFLPAAIASSSVLNPPSRFINRSPAPRIT
jgi:hypothetical protein